MKEWMHYMNIELDHLDQIVETAEFETFNETGELVECEDLTFGIQLTNGMMIVLPPRSRILCHTNNLEIQILSVVYQS